MPLVSFQGYSLRYGETCVLRDLSLSIEQGEFAGLMGSVGCGKTSLILSINGVLPQLVPAKTEGKVVLAGKEVSKHSVQELSRHAAFVFQNPDDQLFNLTVREEIAFGLKNQKMAGAGIARRVSFALKQVGLSGFEEKDPSLLSQGQKQKVAIASALASDAELLIFDEPTSSLDHRSSVELYTLLQAMNRQGRTILVVDHDTDLLFQCAKRFLVLDNGSIVLDGGKEIFQKAAFKKAGLKVPCELEHKKR